MLTPAQAFPHGFGLERHQDGDRPNRPPGLPRCEARFAPYPEAPAAGKIADGPQFVFTVFFMNLPPVSVLVLGTGSCPVRVTAMRWLLLMVILSRAQAP